MGNEVSMSPDIYRKGELDGRRNKSNMKVHTIKSGKICFMIFFCSARTKKCQGHCREWFCTVFGQISIYK